MIFRTPSYYGKFRCTADKCSDNCCIGWEIDIDSETADFYSEVGGSFGKRLKNSIKDGSFVLGEDERCPFLNSRNLCDIFTELGEEHLCQICTDHPRFYEWFGKVREGGLGLCCEAAARLILTEDFALTETVTDEEEEPEYELYGDLLAARERIIELLQSQPLGTAVRDMLELAENLESGTALPKPETPDTKAVMRFFAELEPIDESWKPYIEKCMEMPEMPKGFITEKAEYLRRIAVYYAYRFFMKGVFDGEVISKVKLAAVCTWFIARLWHCESLEGRDSFEDMVQAAKNFSKEVEYSEENLERLYDAFYFDEIFGSGKIVGLYL